MPPGSPQRPRGSLQQLAPDRWRIRVSYPRPDGTRGRHTETVHGSRRRAETRRTALLAEIDRGAFADPSRVTLGEFLAEWLAWKRQQVAPGTARILTNAVRHLTTALGAVPLARLTGEMVDRWHVAAVASGRWQPSTVRMHYRILSRALNQARRWKRLPANPCHDATPPRVPDRKQATEADVERLVAQVEQLLGAARGTELYLPILLALGTGLRRGEVLGLRWADLDLPRGRLEVRQALVPGQAGPAPLKTGAARRELRIGPQLVAALQEEQARQAEYRRLVGERDYQDSGHVCRRSDGAPWDPTTLSVAFGRLAKRAGLPGLHFHLLRHAYTSICLTRRVPELAIARGLGHASPARIRDTYGHLFSGELEQVAGAMDGFLQGDGGELGTNRGQKGA